MTRIVKVLITNRDGISKQELIDHYCPGEFMYNTPCYEQSGCNGHYNLSDCKKCWNEDFE